jgi:transglutaminase-like putative cysteine protease
MKADETRSMLAERSDVVDRWRQQITLEPNASKALFAIAGVDQLRLPRDRTIWYHHHDRTVEMPEATFYRFTYEVVSRGDLAPADMNPSLVRDAVESRNIGSRRGERPAPRLPGESRIDPQIAEFARREEVSGTDSAGPLAERRAADAAPSELDLEIATNIANWLRTNFEYTLDLTDAKRIEDRDPMVAFLYDFKRGHCEYFAGAMALMLQSLGIEARMVTGFRSDEYNSWGEGYYIVRQSHAHAWVEVQGPNGWETFDPTSSRMADAAMGQPGLWQQIKHAFNYLEYMWAESVVAYDRESRSNLINTADSALVTTAGKANEAAREVKSWLSNADNFYPVSQRVLTGLVMLLVGFTLAAVAWFVFERWRLRQRAKRIGLSSLPKADQLRLARQLGFYDQLTQLLERRGIARPQHLTPMEFCRTIAYLPAASYETIQRLTELFYRVRYGQRDLTAAQQRRLLKTVETLSGAL